MSCVTVPLPFSCQAPGIESSFMLLGSKLTRGVETDPYFPVLSWLTAFVQREAGRKLEFSQIFQRTTRGRKAPPQVAAS